MWSEEVFQTFAEESRELLREMEEGLLRLEQGPSDPEVLNAVFRGAHTLKGSAGLFALEGLVRFTHLTEGVLDRLRSQQLVAEPALIADLLACRDHLERLVEHELARTGRSDPDLAAEDERLRLRLARYLESPAAAANTALAPRAAAAVPGRWHISLRCGEGVLRAGMDPAAILRYLTTIAALNRVVTLRERIPPLSQLQPEQCYLGCEIDLTGPLDEAPLRDAFVFIEEESLLRILPLTATPAEVTALLAELPEGAARLRPLLAASGFTLPGTPPSPAVAPAAVGAPVALSPPAEAGGRREEPPRCPVGELRWLRVRADKLDRLINLVGELAIAGASAALAARRRGDSELLEASSAVTQIVEQIRDGALMLRMVQIGETFNRAQRIVHDAGHELGKQIALSISGAETELDKSVVEKIADPLTHLIRNAVDHGIEPPAERRARGKPEVGTIHLNACHDSGTIAIEVCDDGRGLDRGRILQKAVERGVVSNPEALSESEIDNLIFVPGLSTAESVSNLSGRGVGMDVVRRNIEALHGRVELHSEPGYGTRVRIRLPLTLAIIEGLLVRVGAAHYVLPLGLVSECMELHGAHGDFIDLRGELLPLIRLRDHFQCEGRPARREHVVVVQCSGRRAGIAVDELLGEFQTVIKPLGPPFEQLPGVSGATILGDGKVALILDLASLLQSAVALEEIQMRATAAEQPVGVRGPGCGSGGPARAYANFRYIDHRYAPQIRVRPHSAGRSLAPNP